MTKQEQRIPDHASTNAQNARMEGSLHETYLMEAISGPNIKLLPVVTGADMYGWRSGYTAWKPGLISIVSILLDGFATMHRFKGSVHIEGLYQGSKLPHNWRVYVSANGCQTKLDSADFKRSSF